MAFGVLLSAFDPSWSGAQSVYEPYAFTTLAGRPGGPGAVDGLGSAARFKIPLGLARDGAGNFYVADSENHTIRKVTREGLVTTVAGLADYPGQADGWGDAARFNRPEGIAADAGGTLYVADTQNHTIRKVTPDGFVTTLAGLAGETGSIDGTGSEARFKQPTAVAVDSAGNVVVSDTRNSTIRKITPSGLVTTLAGLAGWEGSGDGTGSEARFSWPAGVAVDGAGNVYVADTRRIRKVTPDGVVTAVAGSPVQGTSDGTGPEATFLGPGALTFGGDGHLYASDGSVRRITLAGEVTTLAGHALLPGYADGTGFDVLFNGASGLAADEFGDVYVADSKNCVVRKVTSAGVATTFVGMASNPGRADGLGDEARFDGPSGMAMDSAGNLYVSDAGNNTIRKVTPAGLVSTFAGEPVRIGAHKDGPGTEARFDAVAGTAVDGAGNVYVAEPRGRTIRKVSPEGFVTTLAGKYQLDAYGNPVGGFQDGPLSEARFQWPYGVAVDVATNVYVSDTYNHAIRKITPDGVVSTVAGGRQPGTQDGTGRAARFNLPHGLALDASGNLYIADNQNNTIRKMTPDAAVTTLAGQAGPGGSADGTGAAARFLRPMAIAVDAAGNVFVSDSSNHTIRKITPSGVVTTLGGWPGSTGGVDGVGNGARFYYPVGLAVASSGELYLADGANHAIRKGVVALAIMNSGVGFGAGGTGFGFRLSGPGEWAEVQASTDLINWLPVGTNRVDTVDEFSDPESSAHPVRFYRARQP
ncbi:MAG: NHL repeat-containing protein [Verrucomicrobiia bacterium]